MKIISVKAKDNALVFIDYVDDNGQEVSTMIGAASIIANAEVAQHSVQSDGAYCTHCGDLLSDHFINERGEGWCEPPRR